MNGNVEQKAYCIGTVILILCFTGLGWQHLSSVQSQANGVQRQLTSDSAEATKQLATVVAQLKAQLDTNGTTSVAQKGARLEIALDIAQMKEMIGEIKVQLGSLTIHPTNDQPKPDGQGKNDEVRDDQEWQRGDSYEEWQRGIQQSERKVFSQNGEDGVIEYLFERLGTTDRYYVEFGTESGVEVNTRLLREQKGWSGLLMDGGNENKAINLHKAFLMPSTILELFNQFEVPKQFDLLSVDIDSYDLWVWRVLLIAGYRPRVVITEYNRNFMLGCYYTFPDPTGAKVHSWRPNDDRLFGASLSAMELLARQYGYVLVYADTLAINAFFVRGDLLPKDALVQVPISKISRPATMLHSKSNASRAELYVDFLEWSNVYEKSIMSNLGGELRKVRGKSVCMEHI